MEEIANYTPAELKALLVAEGREVKPLSDGSHEGKSFEEGGGYKVNFGRDGLLLYHPAEHSHHGGEYYKIATGKGGIKRYDRSGNDKKD